jgi:hypothetical protein
LRLPCSASERRGSKTRNFLGTPAARASAQFTAPLKAALSPFAHVVPRQPIVVTPRHNDERCRRCDSLLAREARELLTYIGRNLECYAEGKPMLSEEVTVEVPKLNLPPDLVAEVARRNNGKRQPDFRVEGLRPSLIERLARMLGLG